MSWMLSNKEATLFPQSKNLALFVLALHQLCLSLNTESSIFQPRWSLKIQPWTAGQHDGHLAPYLQGGPLLAGPLAGTLSLQPQLHKQLQQVHEQLIHKVLVLDVGRDVSQGVDYRQGAVPGDGERNDSHYQAETPLSPPLQPGAYEERSPPEEMHTPTL